MINVFSFVIRKRNRNTLVEIWRERKAKAKDIYRTEDYYLEKRAVEVTTKKSVESHYHARAAAARNLRAKVIATNSIDSESLKYVGWAIDCRVSIKFLFKAAFGAPVKDT